VAPAPEADHDHDTSAPDRATENGELTPAATVPWGSRTVQVVLASTALAPLGVPLVAPALPAFRDAFLLGDAQASLLISGYFAAGVVLSPFIGLLADRAGRKRVLVGGLLGFGLLGSSVALAPSFGAVLALRLLQGTAAAAIFITTVTLIGDRFEGARRAAVLGVNVAVLSAAAALYPVLGGALVAVGWNVPFLAYLAALPVALFAWVTLEEPTRSAGGRGVAYLRAALERVLTGPTLALFGATFLTEFLAFGVVFTAFPFLLAPLLSPVLVGVVILVAEAVSTVVAAASGRLASRLSSVLLLPVGFACYGVGFLLAWVSLEPAVVAVAAAFVGAGIGLLLPSVDAALTARVPTENRAGALSLRNSTTFLGRSAGPIAFAGLAVTVGVGYPVLLLGAGVLALVAAAVALLVTR